MLCDEAMTAVCAGELTDLATAESIFCGLFTVEPPPPELQALLGAVHGNQDAMDDFAKVNAGVLSPAVFLGEDNVRRIMSQAARTTRRATRT